MPESVKNPSQPGEELAAPFVNQIHLNITDDMARFVFGELVGGGSGAVFPRAAVAFPARGLRDFAALILDTVQKHENMVSAASGGTSGGPQA